MQAQRHISVVNDGWNWFRIAVISAAHINIWADGLKIDSSFMSSLDTKTLSASTTIGCVRIVKSKAAF